MTCFMWLRIPGFPSFLPRALKKIGEPGDKATYYHVPINYTMYGKGSLSGMTYNMHVFVIVVHRVYANRMQAKRIILVLMLCVIFW